MLHHQTRADLEERLSVAVRELIKNRAPGGIGDGAVDVGHTQIIGKPGLACKPGLAYSLARRWKAAAVIVTTSEPFDGELVTLLSTERSAEHTAIA